MSSNLTFTEQYFKLTESSGTVLYGLFVIIILLVFLVYFLFQFYCLLKSKKNKLMDDIDKLRSLTSQYRKRFNLVEKHSADYFHSMSAESGRALTKSRLLIANVERHCDEIENLLNSGKTSAYDEAEARLRGSIELKSNTFESVAEVPQTENIRISEINKILSEVLDVVGKEVLSASERVREISKVKRQSKQTYVDLFEAGVKYVFQNGRRLTKSFFTPFQNPKDKDKEG